MKKYLLLFLLLIPKVGESQAIKTLADSMTAGQWSKLTGVDDAALRAGYGFVTGEVLTFAHSGQWDGAQNNGYFLGCGHGGTAQNCPWVFKYTSSTNSWALVMGEGAGWGNGHNYDHASFDSWRRRIYVRKYGGNQIYGWDTANDTYLGLLTTSQYDIGNVAEGTAWFDGLYGSGTSGSLIQGGLLVYSGENPSATQVHIWEPNKGTGSSSWSEITNVITPGPSSANYHTWSEYSRPYNVTFVGGGNNQRRKIAAIRANRTVEAVPDAPINIGIQASNAVADPRSGKLIVYGNSQLWELGRNATDTAWVWAQLPTPPAQVLTELADPGTVDGACDTTSVECTSMFSMAIDTYGVNMYVRCTGSACYTWLYKHTETDFDIRARQGGVISSRRMDTEADLYYSWGTDSVLDAAMAGRTKYTFCSNRGACLGNTTVVNVNGAANMPRIDRTVKPASTSAGSMLWTSPSLGGTQSGGLWNETLPFGDRTSPWDYYAPGSPNGNVLWKQFKVRFNSQSLTATGEDCGGGTCQGSARKVDVVFGNSPNGSDASGIEITGVIDLRGGSFGLGIPTWYGQIGQDGYPEQALADCTTGGPYTGCYRYTADTWYTITEKYTVNPPPGTALGCGGGATSRLEVWAVAAGVTTATKIMDYPCVSVSYASTHGQGLGTVGFWEYMTNRVPSVHAEARMWIADVIVSTSAIATDGTVQPGDSQAPTIPATLTTSSITFNQIGLQWSASTDDTGVVGYQVERCQGAGCSNFSLLISPNTITHTDTGITASTTYRYRVHAYDAVPNYSGYSSILTVATTVGIPSPPTNLRRVTP